LENGTLRRRLRISSDLFIKAAEAIARASVSDRLAKPDSCGASFTAFETDETACSNRKISLSRRRSVPFSNADDFDIKTADKFVQQLTYLWMIGLACRIADIKSGSIGWWNWRDEYHAGFRYPSGRKR